MHNGLPTHLDDAIDYVCSSISKLEGQSGNIGKIVRGLGFPDRGSSGAPTTYYLRVRVILKTALDRGRVERTGQQWTVARRRKAS